MEPQPQNQKDTFHALRAELADYLNKAYTHTLLADVAKDFPIKLANKKIKGVPYSPWALLEHIHITQHDMLDFIRNPNYKEMEWPKDYWPKPGTKADRTMWDATLSGYLQDVVALTAIVLDTSIDIYKPIPRGTRGQNVFREILQAIDHGSYHLGELVLLRRAMGAWGKK